MSPLLRQKISWVEWWTLGFSIHHAFHVSKRIAKLLKFSFACVCPQRERFLPELPLKTKLSLNSVKLHWTFHCPIIYLWKTNWQFIILQLLKSLTLMVPQMRVYAVQVNLNSLTTFVDLPCEPVATSLFPFVRTAFFFPTGMENGRHPVAAGWWRYCAVAWQSLPAGSSEFPTSPGPGLFPDSFLQSRGVGAFTGGQEGSCPFPPGWSSPQLFVSIDQIWVRIAVFT